MPARPLTHGFLAHRLPIASDVPIEVRLERNKDMLSRCLNLRTTVAVVGAGCSKPLGYPLWGEFVSELLEQAVRHPAITKLAATHEAKKLRLAELRAELGAPALAARLEGLLEIENGSGASADALDELIADLEAVEGRVAGEHTYLLGWVQRLVDGAQRRAERKLGMSFHEMVTGIFRDDPSRKARGPNPYEKLLDLPIQRFVTTNYDTELERAISRWRGVPWARFGIGEPPCSDALSLTQEREFVQQLTRFAIARISSNEQMVFHCHGRRDRLGSIVASEADYQRWYLTPRFDGLAFRHSIDLLFSSNPLLFVGYGLGDEDLLRPLRVLAARDPGLKQARPIFALIDLDAGDARELRRAGSLYDRFGVQVVPFERENGPDLGLTDALSAIRERWVDARKEWSRKPPPRIPFPFCEPGGPGGDGNGKGSEGVHANMDVTSPIEVPKSELEDLSQKIREGRNQVIGLIGPAGSSKSWHAVDQVKKFAKPGEGTFPGGIFYWNAHYANEVLTTLDRMGRYLTGEWRPYEGTVFERLDKALLDRQCLIVIDGCERFMRATDRPLIGQPVDRAAERMFDLLSDPKHDNATILLVGRLWPSLFASDGASPEKGRGEEEGSVAPPRKSSRVIHISLDSIHKSAAVAHWNRRSEAHDELATSVLEKELSGLCTLLEGHNFTLHLAIELLREESHERFATVASALRHELAGVRPDRRRGLVIGRVLERLAAQTNGLGEPLLRLMTSSLNAMSDAAIELCHELADKERRRESKRPDDDWNTPELNTLVGELKRFGLLVRMPRVDTAAEPSPRQTHTVHASLRGYFFDQRSPGEETLPGFALAGFAAGGKDAGRRQAGVESARELFKLLVERGESLLTDRADLAGEADRTASRKTAIDLCRDAYGVLRTRFSATTVPRWGRFADYTALGGHLVHLAKSIGHLGDQNWGQLDSEDLPGVERPDAPLYLAELAWLYNDIAVALGLEGVLDDAVPTFVLAQDFARMIEPTGDGGPYRIQILINLAHAMIERGQLREAERYLARAAHMNVLHGDKDFAARVLGYRGHLNHLRGNLKDASEQYERAIEDLKRVGNVRARSYFFRLWGLLLIHRGRVNRSKLDEAVLHLNAARILAGEGDFRDLETEARIGRGVLYQAFGNLSSARLELNAALNMARDIGSRRLEAEAFCYLARVAIQQGDLEGSSRNATHSIRIANECGLSLRRTHALLVLGMATVDAGEIDLGVAYLRQASKLADRQQYWIRQREAEEELQRMEAGRSRATHHPDGISARRRAL